MIFKPNKQPKALKSHYSNLPVMASPSQFVSQFDPSPSKRLLPKVRFFFKPYNDTLGYAKHMEFDTSNNSMEVMESIK